jgi:hypothetical protein
MFSLRSYLRRPFKTVAAVASDPLETWAWFWEHIEANREVRLRPESIYQADEIWESRLRNRLRALPNEPETEFWPLWRLVIRELEQNGVMAGPESFKGWNDGDAGFVRAIWSIVRRQQPMKIVETGVAHGVTSRFVLEAIKRNNAGHLWSIDRPPMMERELKREIGLAVSSRQLRQHWTYIQGSSRRRLPKLLSDLGVIDLFVHDSLHTEHNVRFELDLAWEALRPGGAVVVDDIDANCAFQKFTASHPEVWWAVCEAEPCRPDRRRFNKKGLFGVILKAPLN